MTLNEEKNGKVFVLGLGGKIDVEGAKMLMERTTQILAGGERYILFDFTEVVYINSLGLRGLVMSAKQLASSGGMMVLAGVTEPVRKVLEMTGLTTLFTLRATRAESLGLFPQ
jgi:anti-anti-sigma factor